MYSSIDANSILPANEPGKITAYPNPVTNKVRINVNNSSTVGKDLILSDLPGRVYAPKSVRKISANSFELDLSGLKSGGYFIRMKINNVNRTFRIVKL